MYRALQERVKEAFLPFWKSTIQRAEKNKIMAEIGHTHKNINFKCFASIKEVWKIEFNNNKIGKGKITLV